MGVIGLDRPAPSVRSGDPAQWLHSDRGPADTDAPVVVLVHGLGTDATAWDRLAGDLERSHRVLTVELPGYSLTTVVDQVPQATELADGLDALLGRLGVDAAVLVGHSFGGAVSLLLAHRHPRRCAGLVLIAPGGFGSELNPLIPLLNTRVGARLLEGLYGPRASRTIRGLAGRVRARAIGGGDSRLRISELMETYDRLGTEQAREQFRAGVRESLALSAAVDRREVADVDRSLPILVLWGREDRVLPSWQAQNAATLLPWAVVHILDGAGHTPHRSMPAVVRREIEAFADRGEVRRRSGIDDADPAGVNPSAG